MNEQVLKTSGANVLSSMKKNSKKPWGDPPPPLPLVRPKVNGPVKLFWFYMQDKGFNSFASNMIKLAVTETK